MNISLDADVARLVESQLSSGRYASASDLVHESLMLLERARALDEAEEEALRAAVAEGVADMDAGRFSDRSVQDILDDVLRREAGRPR